MERVIFTDGTEIAVLDEKGLRKTESERIRRMKEYAETRKRSAEWKYGGEGALFRGDFDRSLSDSTTAYVNAVQACGDEVFYSFSTDGMSGVYRKNLTDEKQPEAHVFTSSELQILSMHLDAKGGRLAVTVCRDGVTSQIGLIDCRTSELKTLTEGDSRDAHPCFSVTRAGYILFDSAGAGRNYQGEFTGKYAPSRIYRVNTEGTEIEEVAFDPTRSLIRPKESADGTLYCIRRPSEEKSGGNAFTEILLIPVRLVQAIALFLQSFVRRFTGKSLVSGGDNPVKGRETDSRKLYVDGNLIQVEKELRRNRRFKDQEYGFIPRSWELVRRDGEKWTVIARGVCDYSFGEDGTLYYTDGKHVFSLKDGKKRKAADADLCLCVCAESGKSVPCGEDSPFEL